MMVDIFLGTIAVVVAAFATYIMLTVDKDNDNGKPSDKNVAGR